MIVHLVDTTTGERHEANVLPALKMTCHSKRMDEISTGKH
jgi:hypothetical protein